MNCLNSLSRKPAKQVAPQKRSDHRGFASLDLKKSAAMLLTLGATAVCLAQQGTWTPVRAQPSDSLESAMLMTDGSVIVKSYSNYQDYFKLTPDANFSYANGSWSQLPNSINGVLYGPTEVMRDGRLFIAGGEYLSNTTDHNTAQIYNPVTNSWSSCPDGLFGAIGDTGSSILSDGKILCSTWNNAGTQIYDPLTNTWTQTGTMNQNSGDEESWVILPDGSILNVYSSGQRYIPSQHRWVYTPALPSQFVDDAGEIGPLVYLYTGQALIFGGNVGTGATGLYTPPSSLLATDDSWSPGPVLPNGFGCADVPACVEVNGKVLFIASDAVFGAPTFFEYDPVTNLVTQIVAPDTGGAPDFVFRMLALPNGQILVTGFGSQAWLYTPVGSPKNAWKAHLSSVVRNVDSTYTLTGTQLNGLTNGAAYGDECTPNTNYPVITLKNLATGKYYYPRTFNHTNMLLATGSAPVQTTFSLPANLPGGTYQLTSYASGIASANSLTFAVGLSMPNVSLLQATPGGKVTYSLPVIDGIPGRTVTAGVQHGPAWVSWDGTTLTCTPPIGTPAAEYPVLLSASDNGTPPLTGQVSLYVKVGVPGILTTSLATPTVAAGGTDVITVTLSQPAGHGGAVVGVTRKSGPITVPTSITIPEGQTVGTFTLTAGTVTTATLAQVTLGLGSTFATVTVRVTKS